MESNLVKFPRGWIRVGADSILQPTWVLAPACNLQLSQVPAAGFKLRLSRAPAAGYKSRLTPSYSWIEFRQLDTTCSCLKFWRLDASYGWLHPTADSSSDSCIRVAADSIQRLDTSYSWLCPTADSSSGGLIRLTADLSCGWLQVVTDSILRLTRVPVAGLEMRLTYTLIYQVNLRTCSAKYIFRLIGASTATSRPVAIWLPPDFWPQYPLTAWYINTYKRWKAITVFNYNI